eukprot:CAMPEP_0182473166 /NCGR_PEP_ID=MMETSP1319-20130603/23446_1 /TAXON_ID=172717 /ORGANISM="Bolidomonas pacifica, Strain RCC208" /LENGTH=83 /DNA_ID=CAMNT_0024673931 /DNA_START=79 /DNA_END=327 /DNA_ORIENTATION=-
MKSSQALPPGRHNSLKVVNHSEGYVFKVMPWNRGTIDDIRPSDTRRSSSTRRGTCCSACSGFLALYSRRERRGGAEEEGGWLQ